MDLEDLKAKTHGRWPVILRALLSCDDKTLSGEKVQCPACGGDDRFRFDDKNGDGSFYCSKCGGVNSQIGGGGNGFDLIMRVLKIDFFQAVKMVSEFIDGKSILPAKTIVVKKKLTPLEMDDAAWRQIKSLDFYAYNEKAKKRAEEDGREYKSSRIRATLATEVKDRNGIRVGAVVRMEINGKKITPQVIMNADHGISFGAIKKPCPLIGAHHVDLDSRVYVVEGEKCYTKMIELGYNCVTSVGGSGAFLHSDWKLLEKSDVVILRDNDEKGIGYALGISGIIKARIVNPPEASCKGWDVADGIRDGWGHSEINEWITSQVKDSVVVDTFPVANIDSYGWPDIKPSSGKPKATIENYQYLLNMYNINCKYNVINKSVELFIPGLTTTYDNRDNVALANLTSMANRHDLPDAHIKEYVKAIADKNQYNPIANFIMSKPWDGIDRVPDIMATLKTAKTKIRDLFVLRWLVSAVSVNFDDNGAEGVLVLQGGQGFGKSRWLRRLLPPEMVRDYIAEGVKLDPENKDSVIKCVTKWLVELGELGSTFRKDLDLIKSFIADKTDRLRRPYAPIESQYIRRTVFFASVNEAEFLKDPTGSRRWFVIPITDVDYMHNIDVQQLWAQIYVLYKNGERGWINREEIKMLELSNLDHNEEEPSVSKLHQKLDWDSPQMDWRWLTATEIAEEIGYLNPSKSITSCIGKELDRIDSPRTRSHGRNLRFVPRKRGEYEEIPAWL